jgi:hypothetical protein
VTVTGEVVYDSHVPATLVSDAVGVTLPGVAPVDLDTTHVNFGSLTGAADADLACTGTVSAPTAPAGKVCIYLSPADSGGLDPASLQGDVLSLPSRAFQITWTPVGAAGDDEFMYATWAYTAP